MEQFIISYTDRVILPRCSYNNSIPAGILSVNHTNPGIGSSEIVCPRKITTSITVLDLICAQVHRVPQWAALSTHLSLRRVPPQKMFAKDVEEELERPTCHPISPLLAFCPPTILEPLTVFRPHLQLKKKLHFYPSHILLLYIIHTCPHCCHHHHHHLLLLHHHRLLPHCLHPLEAWEALSKNLLLAPELGPENEVAHVSITISFP